MIHVLELDEVLNDGESAHAVVCPWLLLYRRDLCRD
jgi:hypothetical protein